MQLKRGVVNVGERLGYGFKWGAPQSCYVPEDKLSFDHSVFTFIGSRSLECSVYTIGSSSIDTLLHDIGSIAPYIVVGVPRRNIFH